jgi:hypothetical protein
VSRGLGYVYKRQLRRIGTPPAIAVLREASTHGPRGARAAARAELSRLG